MFVLHYPVWYRIIMWAGFVLLVPSVLFLSLIAYAVLLSQHWFWSGVIGAYAAGLGYLLIRSVPALLKMNLRAELTREGVHIRKGYPARLVPWQEFGDVRESLVGRRYLDRQGREIFTLFTDARGLHWLDACLQFVAARGARTTARTT